MRAKIASPMFPPTVGIIVNITIPIRPDLPMGKFIVSREDSLRTRIGSIRFSLGSRRLRRKRWTLRNDFSLRSSGKLLKTQVTRARVRKGMPPAITLGFLLGQQQIRTCYGERKHFAWGKELSQIPFPGL